MIKEKTIKQKVAYCDICGKELLGQTKQKYHFCREDKWDVSDVVMGLEDLGCDDLIKQVIDRRKKKK